MTETLRTGELAPSTGDLEKSSPDLAKLTASPNLRFKRADRFAPPMPPGFAPRRERLPMLRKKHKRAHKKPPAPQTAADRALVAEAGRWVDLLQSPLGSEASRTFFTKLLVMLVSRDRYPLLKLVQMADDVNWGLIADAAVRQVAMETVGQWHPLIQNYMLVHSKAPPRGRGRSVVDQQLRDEVVAVWVALGRDRWTYLALTRNEATASPSVCWVIARACCERGITISERRVEAVYRQRAHLMPRHRGWLADHDPDRLIPPSSAL